MSDNATINGLAASQRIRGVLAPVVTPFKMISRRVKAWLMRPKEGIDTSMSGHDLRGVLAPVVTPFEGDLSPDSERFIAHCKWLLSQNCGLAVFGTNSEANSLSMEERSMLLDELVAAGVDPSRMMPGTGCCSIMETVKLTKQAVGNGCAGVLMLPPFYYKDVSEEGLYRYFSEVVQRVGDARLKIYLYHIPPVAVVGITPKLVERLLAAYPDAIAGMKDSSGDWNNTKTFLDAFSVRSARDSVEDSPCGSHLRCFRRQRNVPARQYAERRCRYNFRDREREPGRDSQALHANWPIEIRESRIEIGDQQAKLNVVRQVFSNKKFPSMIAALKQAIAIYADDPAWRTVRPPLVEFTPEQAKTLAAELKAIGFRWESKNTLRRDRSG